VEPISDGAPQLSVRFTEPRRGEPPQLVVPLNFDDGDPVEVFTRVPTARTPDAVSTDPR